jgi:hypothetical protein
VTRRIDKYRLPQEQVDLSADIDWNGYTEQFRAYATALGALCPNFSDNDVARALDDGLSVEDAAAEINRESAEEIASHDRDFEAQIVHDHSMDS